MYELLNKFWVPVFDGTETVTTGVQNNENDPLIPENWANESIAILVENMVVGNLVHRDFNMEVASYGDTIHTRKPGTFTTKRKIDSEEVTTQTAEVTDVEVKLNQHHHVSFYLKDGEESLSFKDLVGIYLEPALIAIAQGIDKILLGQHIAFRGNCAGYLNKLTNSNGIEYLTSLRQVMNENKVPSQGRNLIIGPAVEALFLQTDSFTEADKVGDDGTALREASLGRKFGFNIFMCQNMSEFTNADTATATTTATAAGAAGGTTLTLTSVANVAVGDVILLDDDATPRIVTAKNGTTAVVTFTPALRTTVAIGDAVSIYGAGKINKSTTTVATGGDGTNVYRAGWHGNIIIDNLATTPSVCEGMQIALSYGTTDDTTMATYDVYTVIDVVSTDSNTATVYLDRPLDHALTDNGLVACWPTGKYAFAFHKNALTMVNRPLRTPRQGTGAMSAVVNYDGLAIRVTMTYNGEKQATLVTVDLLMGVKVLDTDLGAVLYC